VPHGKSVKADAPTLAPLCQGKSHCPAPVGRQPGLIAEPAAGVIVALQRPVDQPRDARDVEPWVGTVEQTSARVGTRPTRAIPSLAGDLARHDASWREALQTRGSRTVGSPRAVDPGPPSPTPEDGFRRLEDADWPYLRPPPQVQLAYAWGDSRPVVERLSASVRRRGAARLTDTGHRGAIVQTGMAVMAHQAAPLGRIHDYRLSTRARLFRRRRLRCRTVHHDKASINE
jgi:hypothetical protein